MVRQTRAIETRQSILLAAAIVFEQRGFAAARIEEIIAEAGVTKGALYFHFDSKEALAAAIMSGHASWQSSMDTPHDIALQGLIDLGAHFAKALTEDPIARARARLALERHTFSTNDPIPYTSWEQTVRRILSRCAERGEIRPGVDPLVAADVITAQFLGVHLTSEARTARGDLFARMNRSWEILLPAIATDEVREKLVLPQE